MWLYIFQNAMWFFRSEKLACSHGFLTTELTCIHILNRFSCLMIYSQKSVKPLFPLMIIFKSKEILPNWQVGQKIHLSRFFYKKLLLFTDGVIFFFINCWELQERIVLGRGGPLIRKSAPLGRESFLYLRVCE